MLMLIGFDVESKPQFRELGKPRPRIAIQSIFPILRYQIKGSNDDYKERGGQKERALGSTGSHGRYLLVPKVPKTQKLIPREFPCLNRASMI